MTPAAAPWFRTELFVPEGRPEEVFDRLFDELEITLPRSGVRFQKGSTGALWARGPDGKERKFAHVTRWEPGHEATLEWSPTDWEPKVAPAHVVYRFDAVPGGTRVTVEYQDWGSKSPVAERDHRIGWFASEVVRPLVRATSPVGLGDWLTDRAARRPTGPTARATYADPMYHRPNFLLILERLRLAPDDVLLEVGCGGGAFLHDALASGCRAFAVDHSAEMVRLARGQNSDAIQKGRLEIQEAEADHLPFSDALCSCAVTTGVFGFIDRPVDALREMLRVLRPGGRLVLFTGTKELRGTPATPEPVASRVFYYEDDELAEVARLAGFTEIRVDRPPFGDYARKAGLPPDAVAFFESIPRGGQVLEAKRPVAGAAPTT